MAISIQIRTFAFFFFCVVSACARVDDDLAEQDVQAPVAEAEAMYIGSAVCGSCHAEQYELWQQSHHVRAMEVATAETVLGDFDGQRFEYQEKYIEFFLNDGTPTVRTNDYLTVSTAQADINPTIREFEVVYTFGFNPLQQYLVALENGRLQALNIAWDSRPASNGGQRWFDLYEGEQLGFDDPLHWTSDLHTWNSRCADCHSTHVDKAYDALTQEFSTTMAEVNVGCEACHGPGSLHAANTERSLPIQFADQDRWQMTGESIAVRVLPQATMIANAAETEVVAAQTKCVACHSRRGQTQIARPSEHWLNSYEPALLAEGLYHPDGQILDEVFVYGSFAQSAMHAAGVVCGNCHDSHSNALLADGDALCGTCHRADVFATPEHHFHDRSNEAVESSVSNGPACVDCHMTAQTYMGVDRRRDHSFRVPRPDLSIELGTPNACVQCHEGQTNVWAADTIEQWYPGGRQTSDHYGVALAAGRDWTEDRRERLLEVIYSDNLPDIVRATALSHIKRQLDSTGLDAIEFSAQQNAPLLILAALDVVTEVEPQFRTEIAQRFLDHELRSIRIAAARALIGAEAGLSALRRRDYDFAINEYESALQFNSDAAEGRVGLGYLSLNRGDLSIAEARYREAIELNAQYATGYVNLADLMRQTGREREAVAVLTEAINIDQNKSAILHASLGLAQVRVGNTSAALSSLDRAMQLAPGDPYHAYAYALALDSIVGRADAIALLEQTAQRFPGYAPSLFALATMYRDGGETALAQEFGERLLRVSPGHFEGIALMRQLGL